MVVFYTFSVVVVVVVVVGGEGVDAGKRGGGEAVGEAVGCGRRGVGDGGEGVDVGFDLHVNVEIFQKFLSHRMTQMNGCLPVA